MRNQTNKAEALLSLIRRGEHMTFKQQLELTIRLSIPAVVAQISYIVMQYITRVRDKFCSKERELV